MLSFGFLVGNKTVNRILFHAVLHQAANYLVEILAEIRRSTFGYMTVLCLKLTRLVWRNVNPCKGDKLFSPGETTHIANFSHNLRPEGCADTTHIQNNRIFRKSGRNKIHLLLEFSQRQTGIRQFPGCLLDNGFSKVVFRQRRNAFFGEAVDCFCLVIPAPVAIPAAPVLIHLGEGVEGLTGYAFRVSETTSYINPFLVAVRAAMS